MHSVFTKIIFIMIISAMPSMNLFAAELVVDGKPTATIVIDINATKSTQLAALELQYHIEKITGAKLLVTSSQDTENRTKILVGESQATRELGLKNADFKNQEYLVRVKGDTVVLIGKDKIDQSKVDYNNASTFPDMFDEVGSCYAVYDFLEKLGVRWYLPTDLGVTFTPSFSLAISDVEVRRSPSMKYREGLNIPYAAAFALDTIDTGNDKFVPMSIRETVLFKLRHRHGGNRICINHSLYPYYNRFLSSRPEWFAKGYEGTPPQLCYSNPELLQQVIQDARDFFDGKTDAAQLISNVGPGFKSDVFPVFPMDNSSWCKCPKCQAQLKPKAEKGAGQFSNDQASDYIFGFVNKVAAAIGKTHPGKYIGAGTYAEFCYPPEKIRLEPNVMTMHCLHNRMVYAKHIQENDNIILDSWKNSFPDTPKTVWMYYCFPTYSATIQQFRCFPGFFSHHIAENMRRYSDANVKGIFVEPSYMGAAKRNGILMDQLSIYLTMKLADDPTLNADVLIDEFFVRYYGPAAEPMRQFYLLVENTYCDPNNYPPQTKDQNAEIAWTRLGTEDCMKKLADLMGQAKAKAVSEPYRERVAVFDKGIWQYMLNGRKDYLERESMMAPTMQQATTFRVTNKEPGNPLTANWADAAFLSLRYGMKADITKYDLKAKLGHDGQFFYLMLEQDQVDTDELYTNDLVWLNDEWECFFARQRGTPYRQIAVDAAGKYAAVEHEGTVTKNWDFKGKVISQKDPVSQVWKVYIAIPLSDLVLNGINPNEMLYFNVIRSQKCNYLGSWIPTFGGYHAPGRFGEVFLNL